jgi:hypothetical protein
MENLEQAPQISVLPAIWCADSETWLNFARQHASLADLQEQVEQGAALFHVFCDARLVGAFILRIDESASGSEGVIVAGAGRLPGFDFIVDLVPHIEKLFRNVNSIRIHTARPGLIKKLAKAGYEASEMVLRKAVE